MQEESGLPLNSLFKGMGKLRKRLDDAVAELLESKDLNQRDLAAAIGITEVQLSKILNGKTKLLRDRYIEDIASFFSVDVSRLFMDQRSRGIYWQIDEYVSQGKSEELLKAMDLLSSIGGGPERTKKAEAK